MAMKLKTDFNLGKMPWYGQVGVFLALSVAGVAAFYFLYAAPARQAMAQQQTKLASLRNDINKGLATARKLPEFRADVQALQVRLEGLRAVLPQEKDVADLLRRIQTLAVQSNLTIRGVKPGTVAPKTMYAEVPYTLELDGAYHNLGVFFDWVSKFPRIINISGIDIRAKDKPEANSTITATCVATTYILVEAPPETTPAKPGAPGAKPAAPSPSPAGAPRGNRP